jgi:hypothetical protein
LFYLNSLGLVEPEEERRHWCFHVMVSPRYNDWRQTQTIFPVLSVPPVERSLVEPAPAATVVSVASSN